MKTILILEEGDAIQASDWCRPLTIVSMSGGHSDTYSFTCQYTSKPINNAKWVEADQIFGELWFGKTVGEIHESLGLYEFARGDVPEFSKFGETEPQKRERHKAEFQVALSYRCAWGKYKRDGWTWEKVKRVDPGYFDWVMSTGYFEPKD